MRWSEHPDKAHESKVDKSTQVMVLSYSPSRNSFTYTPRNIETVTLLHIQAKEDRRSHIPSQQVSLNMEDGLSMRKRRFSWRAKGGLVKEPRLKKKKKLINVGDILTPSQHLCHLFIPESDHLIQEKIVLQSCHVSTYWRKFFITYMCYLCSKRIESPWFIFLQLRVQIWVGTLAAEAFIFFVWFEMECIHSQNNILERFSLLCI